jgi:excisionase family DNA binding protein
VSQSDALPEVLLRPDQVAKVFNVSPRTVTYWAWTGRLPSVKTPGGHYRFRPADLDALLASPAEVA